ncbi:MAG: glycerate dehydrogenase [Clostridia bacterium]|nr:glycerate dehydrogenase [Clostridia bacterium]
MKAIFLCENRHNIDYVYGPAQMAELKRITGIDGKVYSLDEARRSPEARTAEVIFSTWGMPKVAYDEILEVFPELKAVFYGAGSVQAFAEPFIRRGIDVFSAWQANAVPVAEYTLAQILLASKGFFTVQQRCRTSRTASNELSANYPGMYDIRVGLLGLGAVGGAVAKLLKGFNCEVLAYDPFASDEKMEALGARRADMAEIFASCDIVSNHLANLPETKGIITREHIFALKLYSTFINTGRGPQLSEEDLYDKLRADETVTALLDVLTDEQYSDTNPLNTLPNCFITPHIAGSKGNEVRRMAQYMIEEYGRWQRGEALNWRVTADMLATMA